MWAWAVIGRQAGEARAQSLLRRLQGRPSSLLAANFSFGLAGQVAPAGGSDPLTPPLHMPNPNRPNSQVESSEPQLKSKVPSAGSLEPYADEGLVEHKVGAESCCR